MLVEFQGNQHGNKWVYEELPVSKTQAGSKKISKGFALSKGRVLPEQNHPVCYLKKS